MNKKIAWLVPYPIEGSGGLGNIFYNMNYLADNGYECHAYIENPGGMYSDKDMRRVVEQYFGAIKAEFYSGFTVDKQYDLIFATAWYTAKFVRDIKQNCKKAYFIQDFEALFNPMGDGYLLAENSYRYGLIPVTIGKWLSHKMINDFNINSNYFEFCADLNIYKRNPSITKEKAVCFVYQPEKPRRCSLIGIEALGIVKHLVPDVNIYLFGSTVQSNIWFPHINLPLLSYSQCNELYNKCMVGLCISSSNPSRIPFEMMATGLPVVDLYMDNNLYDMPSDGILLAQQTPESIAQAIITLLKDKGMRDKMSEYGINYMKGRPIELGYKQFLNIVNNILENGSSYTSKIDKTYSREPIIADVYINKTVENLQSCNNAIVNESRIKQSYIYKKLRKLKRAIIGHK